MTHPVNLEPFLLEHETIDIPPAPVPRPHHLSRLVRAILEYRLADVLAKDPTAALQQLIEKGKYHEALTLLRIEKKNLNLNQSDQHGNTLLHTAVHTKNPDLVIALIAAGANPNVFNNAQETPLYLAVTNNYSDVAMALFVCKADVNAQNTKFKNTLLHFAVLKGNLALAEQCLITFEVNPHIQNADKTTPLYLAIECGKIAMVHLLLKTKGPDGKALINPEHRPDNISMPPIHWAYFNCQKNIATLLSLYGANPNRLSEAGVTANEIAVYDHTNTLQPAPNYLPSVGYLNSTTYPVITQGIERPPMSYKP